MKYILISALVCAMPNLAMAHGGGLNSEGCHNDRKRGTYHCHRSSYTPSTATSFSSSRSSSYSNFSQASSSSRYNKTQILTIQTLLKHHGYSVGTIDGIFGNNTRRAIESFRRDNRLFVSGLPNDQLILDLSKAL